MNQAQRRTGVVVMAYGTPADVAEIEAYYTHIRRGRVPTPEQLAELVARYQAIGGLSPLAEITDRQLDALRRALGDRFVVTAGMKHSEPMIERGVATLAEAGVDAIVGLVLAPHDSEGSVGTYLSRFDAAAQAHGLTATAVRSWATDEAFVAFSADAVTDALATVPAGSELVFTAHSLPQRLIDSGDIYPTEVRATAEAVVARLDTAPVWSIAWQSAGRTPEPWLGPDVRDVVRDAAARGVPGIVVAAVGFVADHLEILHDLDIATAAIAREVGIAFTRTRCVNDDPTVFASLAATVREAARELHERMALQ